MVIAVRPSRTGFRLRRASSNGLTPQIAAAGMSAHGIRVPPPTQMAATCPRAVSVAAPEWIAAANSPAIELTSEMPENPSRRGR